jgi:hypothetical protein
LVEGTFARLFGERLHPLEVATHLTRAMEDHEVTGPEGTPYAPTHYWIHLNPDDHQALAEDRQSLEEALIRHVTELASQAGQVLSVTPTVHVLMDEGVEPHQVHIEARWMPEQVPVQDGTREMDAEEAPEEKPEGEELIAPPGRPFLILEGQRHVNLLEPVISIGRAVDNDIIIEDSRVSRHHAQLRRRYDRYVLYDLGSTGGTEINSYPVEECVLHSGDVISFAGVQVIYGEDPPTPIPLPTHEDTPAVPESKPESE